MREKITRDRWIYKKRDRLRGREWERGIEIERVELEKGGSRERERDGERK